MISSRDHHPETSNYSEEDERAAQASGTDLTIQSSPQFLVAPELVLLPSRTNLYDTPASWLLKNATTSTRYKESLVSFLEQEESSQESMPDFAADNHVLRELLSWQFSNRLVSVVIHRIGGTLVLQGLAPTFTGPAPLPQHAASLVSGLDVAHPISSSNPSHNSNNASDDAFQSTSLEEQSRLRDAATKQILLKLSKRKNSEKLRQAQLLSKLHYRTLEQNGFTALSPDDHVSVHQWQHRDHNIALTSDVMVYNYKRKPTTLDLRNARDGPHSRASVVRLFLDNIMAGIPQLALCWHEDGMIQNYQTLRTHEIPSKLNEKDPVEISDIEKSATALLSFLKRHCKADLSIHWLFKGEGDEVARLWRLDPVNDCSIDIPFREKVLYQMSMLCLRSASSTKDRNRQRHLLENSINLLDAAAELAHGPSRRPLRAAMRERLVDLLLGAATAGGDQESSFQLSTQALHQIEVAYGLLRQEEEELLRFSSSSNSNNNNNTSRAGGYGQRMIVETKARLAERGVMTAIALSKLLPTDPLYDSSREGHPSYGEMLQMIEVALDVSLNRAQQLSNQSSVASFSDSEVRIPSSNTFPGGGKPILEDLSQIAMLCLGEVLMKRAKFLLGDITESPNLLQSVQLEVKSLLERAVESFSNAEQACTVGEDDEDIFNRTAAIESVQKISFLRGNALNEYGKLLLSQRSLNEARNLFARAADSFRQAADFNNVAVVRCNIAHTYRIAFQSHPSPAVEHDCRARRNLLELAIEEFKDALSECGPRSATWQTRLKSEIFKTKVALANEIASNPFSATDNKDALVILHDAMAFATNSVETATAHFHLANVRTTNKLPISMEENPMELRISKRYFERAIQGLPLGHALRIHAQLALVDLLFEKLNEPAERVIRSILVRADFAEGVKRGGEGAQKKFLELVPRILTRCASHASDLKDRERAKAVFKTMLERNVSVGATDDEKVPVDADVAVDASDMLDIITSRFDSI